MVLLISCDILGLSMEVNTGVFFILATLALIRQIAKPTIIVVQEVVVFC